MAQRNIMSHEEAHALSIPICQMIRKTDLFSVVDVLRGWVNDYDGGLLKVIKEEGKEDRIVRYS